MEHFLCNLPYEMYAFASCNELKVLKRKATTCDMSFRSGNIEITNTELIVYGCYFCFGSRSAKRVSLSDIRTVKEIETNGYNSKTCGAAAQQRGGIVIRRMGVFVSSRI